MLNVCMYVHKYFFTEHRRSTAMNKTLVYVCMYVCMKANMCVVIGTYELTFQIIFSQYIRAISTHNIKVYFF